MKTSRLRTILTLSSFIVVLLASIILGCTEQSGVLPPSEIPRLTISIEEHLNKIFLWIRPTLGDFIIYRNISVYMNESLAARVENSPSLLYVMNLSDAKYNVSIVVNYYDPKNDVLRVYEKTIVFEIINNKIYVNGVYHGTSYDVTLEETEVIENVHERD